MSNTEAHPSLKVHISYGDLETNIEGDYSDVWRLSNDFFKGIRQTLDTKKSIISIKGKSVPEILLDLRNQNFFDASKSTSDCFNKLKELGKTGITQNAIAMALKSLVEKGELVRKENPEKPGQFLYLSPQLD